MYDRVLQLDLAEDSVEESASNRSVISADTKTSELSDMLDNPKFSPSPTLSLPLAPALALTLVSHSPSYNPRALYIFAAPPEQP